MQESTSGGGLIGPAREEKSIPKEVDKVSHSLSSSHPWDTTHDQTKKSSVAGTETRQSEVGAGNTVHYATHTHIYIHIYTHAHTRTCIQTHTHKHAHAHAHKHTHTHTHTHTHKDKPDWREWNSCFTKSKYLSRNKEDRAGQRSL